MRALQEQIAQQADSVQELYRTKAEKEPTRRALDLKADKSDLASLPSADHLKDLEELLRRLRGDFDALRDKHGDDLKKLKDELRAMLMAALANLDTGKGSKGNSAGTTLTCLLCGDVVPETSDLSDYAVGHRRLLPKLGASAGVASANSLGAGPAFRDDVYRGGFRMPMPGTLGAGAADGHRPQTTPGMALHADPGAPGAYTATVPVADASARLGGRRRQVPRGEGPPRGTEKPARARRVAREAEPLGQRARQEPRARRPAARPGGRDESQPAARARPVDGRRTREPRRAFSARPVFPRPALTSLPARERPPTRPLRAARRCNSPAASSPHRLSSAAAQELRLDVRAPHIQSPRAARLRRQDLVVESARCARGYFLTPNLGWRWVEESPQLGNAGRCLFVGGEGRSQSERAAEEREP